MYSRKILLVDDDPDDKEMFIEVLGEVAPELRCITASNGQDALKLLKEKQERPYYIFLDLNMPRLNGKQCLTEIKKIEELKHIPVIIYSTSKLTEDILETKELGAAFFLTKPNTFGELKKALSNIFYQSKGSGLHVPAEILQNLM